jgi:diaminopimelate epimerase
MASIKFIRANGLGNDFLIYDKTNSNSENLKNIFSKENIIRFCARSNKNTGGCDQLILVDFKNETQVFMTIYNSDGSEVYACGNATRCVIALNDKKFSGKNTEVRTVADSLNGKIFQKLDENNFMVSVNMNKPITNWKKIPLAKELDYKNLPIEVAGFEKPFAVSMGNPHMVFTTNREIGNLDIPKIAAPLEYHELFPERANVGFAQIIDQNNINLRVYERGAGETLACGTGACAAGFAAMERGLVNKIVNIKTRGGNMIIEQNNLGEIIMTGPAEFEKEVEDEI